MKETGKWLLDKLTLIVGYVKIFWDRNLLPSEDITLLSALRWRELNSSTGRKLRDQIDLYLSSKRVYGVKVLGFLNGDYYSISASRSGSKSVAVHIHHQDKGPKIHARGLYGDGPLGREIPFLNDERGYAALCVAIRKHFVAHGNEISPNTPQMYKAIEVPLYPVR